MLIQEKKSKIYKIIIDPPLFFGVSKRAFIANLALWITPIVGIQIYVSFAFFLATHILLIFFTQNDPDFFEIMLKKRKQHAQYVPWPSLKIKKNKRPHGFGRGLWC